MPVALLFLQYIFTARPLSGGESATTTSSGPEVTFSGLTPGTQVGARVLSPYSRCQPVCLPPRMPFVGYALMGQYWVTNWPPRLLAAAVRGVCGCSPAHRQLHNAIQHSHICHACGRVRQAACLMAAAATACQPVHEAACLMVTGAVGSLI